MEEDGRIYHRTSTTGAARAQPRSARARLEEGPAGALQAPPRQGNRERPDDQSRAIAIDCGSHDYLDNQELRKALSNALPAGKKAGRARMRRLPDEHGRDRLRDEGHRGVHGRLGGDRAGRGLALRRDPQEAGRAARDVAGGPGQDHRHRVRPLVQAAGEGATQSALDLGRVQPVADAIDGLAREFLKDLNGVAGAVSLARDKSQKFEYPEYVDLGDFAAQVIKRLPNKGGVVAAANKILAALGPASGDGAFVVQNATTGAKLRAGDGRLDLLPERQGPIRAGLQ